MRGKVGTLLAFLAIFVNVFINTNGDANPTDEPTLVFNYQEGQEPGSYTLTHGGWKFVQRMTAALRLCEIGIRKRPHEQTWTRTGKERELGTGSYECETARDIAIEMEAAYYELRGVRPRELEENCKETRKGEWSPKNPEHGPEYCNLQTTYMRQFALECTKTTELDCLKTLVAKHQYFLETNQGLNNDCKGKSVDNYDSRKFHLTFSPAACFRFVVLELNKWHEIVAYQEDPCLDLWYNERQSVNHDDHGELVLTVCDTKNVLPNETVKAEFCEWDNEMPQDETDAEVKKRRAYMDEHSGILRGFNDDGDIIINGGFNQGGRFPIVFKNPFVTLDLVLCQEAGSICDVHTWKNFTTVFPLDFTDSGAVCAIPPLTAFKDNEKLPKNKCVKGKWKMSNGFGEKELNVRLPKNIQNQCRMTLTIKSDGIEKCAMSWHILDHFDARHHTGKAVFKYTVTVGTSFTKQTSQANTHTDNQGTVVGGHEETEKEKKMTTFTKNMTKNTDEWNAKLYTEGKGTINLSKNISAEGKTGGEVAYKKVIENGQDTSVQLENGDKQKSGTSHSESNSVSESVMTQVMNAVTSTESTTISIELDCPIGEITHLEQLQITCGDPPTMVHKSPYYRAYVGDAWDPKHAVGAPEDNGSMCVKVGWLLPFVAFIAFSLALYS